MGATRFESMDLLKLLAGKRPLVIGHRGFCQRAPENTLLSFDLALDAGADLIELDYRHSRDGVPVVIHDAELDRTTDAYRQWNARHVKVVSKTTEEIQRLDAGSWFSRRFAGTRIPTLAEALSCIQKGSFAVIERKAGDAATCVRLLREMGLTDRVVVIAFDWEFLREFHRLEPTAMLGALGPPTELADGAKPSKLPKRLSKFWLDELVKTGARLAVWDRHVSVEAVQIAVRLGLKVWVYTVNDLRLAKRLVRTGVQGLITDDPRKLKDSLKPELQLVGVQPSGCSR